MLEVVMDQEPSSQAPMFERYTERARRVLFFARYEAGRAGSPVVEPEHLLLALIREGKGLSARIFKRACVSADEVRRAIESRTIRREAISSGDDLPLSASTEQVLEFAAQESDRLLHNYVSTEHLLLGVFREERSLAASILAERGLLINKIRDDIVMLLCAPPMPPVRQTKPDIPPSTEVTIKPTDRRPHEGVSARRASDYWVVEGVPLKDMLSRLHDIQKERIELPLSLDDDRRYDFLLVLAQPESRETIDRLMREGIDKYFRIRVAAEVRDMDVYVLTAPNGAISATRTSLDEPGSFGWVDIQTPAAAPDTFTGFSDPPWRRDEDEAPTEDELSTMAGEFLKSLAGGWKRGTASIRGISAASTVAQLCEMLEATLDRPVIDETNLDGTYDLNIRTLAESGEEFLHSLCDRLGLAATPARRNVTMLVARDA
jgi:uncharacterized protein (TIGR03435 family)